MDLFGKKKEGEGGQQQQAGGHGIGSLLSSDKAPAQQGGGAAGDLAKDVNSLTRRIRINEERSVNLRKKIQTIEHNMLMNHKKLLSEVKFINEEISEIKRSFEELKVNIRGFGRELQEAAKKEDIQVLERYINMWEPINFVTRKEVERIIKDTINSMNGESNNSDSTKNS